MTAPTQGRRAEVVWTTACRDCGMPCGLNEYHPYAACLMFKACHDSAVVRANLPPSADTLAEMHRRVEELADAARNYRGAVDLMNAAMQDGVNVHGAISGLLGAADVLDAILGGDGKEGA